MNHEITERNRRILIVDDNASIHADFKKILAESDVDRISLARAEAELFGAPAVAAKDKPVFELSSAFQGQNALEMVRGSVQAGRPYAMAFVDVRMPPGWDGIETTTRLWEADPDLQIIICTAYSDYSWDDMIARLGASDRMVILKKPFDTVEVLQLANAFTEKWFLLQQAKTRLHELEEAVNKRTAALQKENAERLMTERALRAAQDKLEHFLAMSPAILYSLRFESGTWLPAWVSHNFANLTGLECSDWYRQAPALDCVEETDRHQVRDSLASLPGHNQLSLQYRVHRKDGSLRWVRDDWRIVRNAQQQPVEIVGCWTDITEQRALEEKLRQSQKMESVGLLAGGIAHDFNNMLTVIRCHVDLLERSGEFSASSKESLQGILKSAERATNLTRQLLAFSRKQVMRPEELNFNTLVGELQKLFRRTLGEHIDVSAICAPELPPLLADPGMIEQVIMNLAINARDAMPTGGRLTFTTSLREIDEAGAQRHSEARPGRFLCLSVADTGCGIAPEHLPHIFEPFFTTKEVGKGTGLGLATAYGIVKQHDGWIEVESRIGRGTTFTIFLPAVSKKTVGSATRIPVPPARGGCETILVVEDEPALLKLVSTTLQRQGYRVFTAGSGVQALEGWSTRLREIDLLLTDMVMPDGLTGWELAQKFQASKPELKTIYMSGYSTDLHGQAPALTQDVCFLAKPFGPQALAQAVRACLDGVDKNKTASTLSPQTTTASPS